MASTLKATYSPFPELVALLIQINKTFHKFQTDAMKAQVVLLMTCAANSVTSIAKYVTEELMGFMALQIHEYANSLYQVPSNFNAIDKNLHEFVGFSLNLIDKASLYQLDEQIALLIDEFCKHCVGQQNYPEAFLKYFKQMLEKYI